MKQDISTWYTPDRALQEEVNWLLTRCHQKYLEFLLPYIKQNDIKTVLEVGCHTGILAAGLPIDISYVGIDTNSWFLDRARVRNAANPASRMFECEDLPSLESNYESDLVLAFSYMKHVTLKDWRTTLNKILSFGQFACFDVQLLDKSLDNGTDYPHVFVTDESLQHAVRDAGHEEVQRAVLSEFTLLDGALAKSVVLWTRRVSPPSDKDEVKGNLPADLAPAPPLLPCCMLAVGGDLVADADLHQYTIRWADDGKFQPVLYKKGKRVTTVWSITLQADVSADEGSSSANTAD